MNYTPDQKARWDRAMQILKDNLDVPSYNAWFKPLRLHAVTTDKIIIVGQNSFALQHMRSRFGTSLLSTIDMVFDRRYELEFYTEDEIKKIPDNTTLNEKYTFDNFVVGASNSFAYAAALAVAEEPSEVYNPLFIYGGVGLGKTHLLHAIGNEVKRRYPDKRVVYITSERFTNDLIHAIKTNTQQAFRDLYREADILLIDDIQFIAGKTSTQEELFNTFNYLYESQKQIVFTSDKPPQQIDNLEERLRSRFEWGLTADIQPPDIETRIAIITKKAEAEGIEAVPDDVLEFIATQAENNIRELEGTLTRVVAYAKTIHQEISLPVAQEALRGIAAPRIQRKATPEIIIRTVCQAYDIDIKDFMSRRRNQEIANPRKIAMYLARELTALSLTDIGKAFGGRDHTTVLHAWRTVSEESSQNRELRNRLSELRQEIESPRA